MHLRGKVIDMLNDWVESRFDIFVVFDIAKGLVVECVMDGELVDWLFDCICDLLIEMNVICEEAVKEEMVHGFLWVNTEAAAWVTLKESLLVKVGVGVVRSCP